MSATLNVWAGAAIVSDEVFRVFEKKKKKKKKLDAIVSFSCKTNAAEQQKQKIGLSFLGSDLLSWDYMDGVREVMEEEEEQREKEKTLAGDKFLLKQVRPASRREGGVLAETEKHYEEGASPLRNLTLSQELRPPEASTSNSLMFIHSNAPPSTMSLDAVLHHPPFVSTRAVFDLWRLVSA
jgi:hypothetical protein